jgi:hypothetical protein
MHCTVGEMGEAKCFSRKYISRLWFVWLSFCSGNSFTWESGTESWAQTNSKSNKQRELMRNLLLSHHPVCEREEREEREVSAWVKGHNYWVRLEQKKKGSSMRKAFSHWRLPKNTSPHTFHSVTDRTSAANRKTTNERLNAECWKKSCCTNVCLWKIQLYPL